MHLVLPKRAMTSRTNALILEGQWSKTTQTSAFPLPSSWKPYQIKGSIEILTKTCGRAARACIPSRHSCFRCGCSSGLFGGRWRQPRWFRMTGMCGLSAKNLRCEMEDKGDSPSTVFELVRVGLQIKGERIFL